MKKALITIVTVAGIAGLIWVITYTPHKPTASTATVPASSSSSSSSSSSNVTPTPATSSASYKDGTFTGSTIDVGYGPVQVAAVISGGRITTVNVLQHPSDMMHSQELAAYAMPQLVSQAVQAQSANVDGVSGATADSSGFQQSLQTALAKAQ